MEKLNMRNLEKKINMDLPIIITIKYSDTGSSLRVIKGLEELNSYRSSKEVLLSSIRRIKELRGQTYIDAVSASYERNYF